MLSTSDRGLCNFLALMKKRNVIWNVTLTFQNDLLYDYPVRGLFRDSFPDQAVPVLRVPCDDVHVLSVSSELQWLSALPHDPRNVNKSKFSKITKQSNCHLCQVPKHTIASVWFQPKGSKQLRLPEYWSKSAKFAFIKCGA